MEHGDGKDGQQDRDINTPADRVDFLDYSSLFSSSTSEKIVGDPWEYLRQASMGPHTDMPVERAGTRSAFCYGKDLCLEASCSGLRNSLQCLVPGTLMAPQVLYRVIFGSSEPEVWQKKRIVIRPAILHEFRRHRVRTAEFPAIVPNPSSTVRGTFITGLTDGDIIRLDSFEGSMYERRPVKVKLLKNVRLEDEVRDSSVARLEGEEVEAETYVWRYPLRDLEDREWDFEHFKKRKMRAWMGFGRQSDSDTEVDEGFASADAAGTTPARVSPNRRSGGTGAAGVK